MGDILEFKRRSEVESGIECIYDPDTDSEHPWGFRVIGGDGDGGVWLSRREYLDLIIDLVDAFEEEMLG